MPKITKLAIDALRAETRDAYLWDSTLVGFAVRARPSGVKTFIYSYRAGGGRAGRKSRVTIGKVGTLTLDQARVRAQQLAGQVAEGRDPMAERRAQQAELERDRSTVAATAEEFIEKYALPRNRSWPETRRILDRYVLPRLGDTPVHKVGRRDIAELLDRVAKDNGLVMADRVLAALRKMLRWHEARDEDFRSPIVAGMVKTSPAQLARSRILDDDEIRAIWGALDATPYPFGPLVKLLFYTAQRRQEVAEAQWAEINCDLWLIPAHRYKTKKGNIVPLSTPAQAVIEDLPRSDPLLFSTNGRSAFSGFSKAKAQLDKASGVTGWRLHDIRRTSKTLMSKVGVRRDWSERVLGHVIGGVEGVYDHHDYLAEKRVALNKLADAIGLILQGQPATNVVALMAAR